MNSTLARFLEALRHADLQISPAEAIDAYRTMSAVGPDNRWFLRDALTISLGKSSDDQRRVEETFDKFFMPQLEEPQGQGTGENEGEGEENETEQTESKLNPDMLNPDAMNAMGAGGASDMAQMMMAGDTAGVLASLQGAAREVGLERMWLFTQKNQFTRRMLETMGLRELERAIGRAEREGDEVLESLGNAGLMEIKMIQAALARVREGTFGVCVNCGEDISEERLETVLPLVKKHECAVVAISNDDSGISNDPDVRFDVAKKIVQRAADHGIPSSEVVVDPLVMPIGAVGDAGRQVMHIVRRLRDELKVNTTCGASNLSFGLPNREGLNAAFLPMAIAAGMTSAITNPLVPELITAVRGADVVMGHDAECMSWIGAYREEDTAGGKRRRGGRRRRS